MIDDTADNYSWVNSSSFSTSNRSSTTAGTFICMGFRVISSSDAACGKEEEKKEGTKRRKNIYMEWWLGQSLSILLAIFRRTGSRVIVISNSLCA